MKRFILVILLLVVVATGLNAQALYTPAIMSANGHTDSTSFTVDRYYVLPAGIKTDSTLQLHYWQYSEDGTPHMQIQWFYTFYVGDDNRKNWNKAANHVVSIDTNTLSSDFSTEGYTVFTLTPNAGDTTSTGEQIIPSGIKVLLTGAASNRIDTQFKAGIVGVAGVSIVRKD